MDFCMEQKIIVLFASPYRIIDERTGEINQGVSVSYILNADLKPESGANGSMGVKPAKASLDVLELPELIKAPAFYKGTFHMKVGSNNKPELTLSKVKYIGEVFSEEGKSFVSEPEFGKDVVNQNKSKK